MRIGIVGCGGIAHAHAKGYQTNGLSISACFDVNAETAASFAEEFGAEVCTSEAGLLDKVDAISICTPPAFHVGTACAALTKNIHVLCEKPIAATHEQALQIQEAANLSKGQCMLAFRHRFLPAIQYLKQAIADEKIGKIIWFKNTFCAPAFYMKDRWFSNKAIAGGGTLMDTTIHSVDIFRFLFGEIAEQHLVHSQHLDGIDVEDTSILTIQSKSGVLGTCLASWVAGHGDASIEIMGQSGSLTFSYGDSIIHKTKENEEIISIEKSDGFAAEISHFIQSIEDGTPVSVDYKDGLAALEVVLPKNEVLL